MARMHSKKRGKSKSRKPQKDQIRIPQDTPEGKEIERLIVSYAKQGVSPALIGEKLKREHKVPYIKHILGRRLATVLKENGLSGQMPADMMDLMRKAVNMHDHISRNKRDLHNATRLKRIEAKIWRLTKYYIRNGSLPQGWRYDPAQARLLVKGSA